MSESRTDSIMRQVEELGYGTPEYHEAMWMLLSVMARRQACIADRLRADHRRREHRAAARAERAGETL